MVDADNYPNKSHYCFPYWFTDNDETAPDGGDKHGIAFNTFTIYFDGDMFIYYGDMDNDSKEFIDCWCSRWDVSNYSVTIETWLKKEDLNLIQNNIKPGAIGELYVILGRPRYYDSTWQEQNTLRIRPVNYTSREYATDTWEEEGTSNLPRMRNDAIIFVKNTVSSPLEGSNGLISYKIEGMISGSNSL